MRSQQFASYNPATPPETTVSGTAGLMALQNDDGRGSVRGMRAQVAGGAVAIGEARKLLQVDAMTTPNAESVLTPH